LFRRPSGREIVMDQNSENREANVVVDEDGGLARWADW
jgi:hypothetical protein